MMQRRCLDDLVSQCWRLCEWLLSSLQSRHSCQHQQDYLHCDVVAALLLLQEQNVTVVLVRQPRDRHVHECFARIGTAVYNSFAVVVVFVSVKVY